MLLPARCPVCLETGRSPCSGCIGRLVAPASEVPAVFVYEGVGRQLLVALKYRNGRSALPWLGRALAALVQPDRFDVVTWAPTHAARRRQRGYDQAELLAGPRPPPSACRAGTCSAGPTVPARRRGGARAERLVGAGVRAAFVRPPPDRRSPAGAGRRRRRHHGRHPAGGGRRAPGRRRGPRRGRGRHGHASARAGRARSYARWSQAKGVSVEISVSSRHVEVPPAVKAAAVDKIGRLDRYVDGMDRAEAHFSEEQNRRIEQREVLEVTMYGHGHQVRAKVAAADQFAAVDAAVAKLETQLHKLKNRLVAKYHGKGHAPASVAGPTRTGDDAVEEPPRLVKTKRFAMKPMTTDEAILQMDLLGHEFFFFHNADTGDRAVLYRRGDGDIGLIEAER